MWNGVWFFLGGLFGLLRWLAGRLAGIGPGAWSRGRRGRRQPPTAAVCFVEDGAGCVRIGVSGNPEGFLADLQAESRAPLTLAFSGWVADIAEARRCRRILHRLLAGRQVRDAWFACRDLDYAGLTQQVSAPLSQVGTRADAGYEPPRAAHRQPDAVRTALAELGTASPLDAATLKRAYRKAARRAHPDTAGDAGGHEAMSRINAAYETLKPLMPMADTPDGYWFRGMVYRRPEDLVFDMCASLTCPNIHMYNRQRQTPLHMAAADGMTDAVRALVDVGAVVDAEGHNGWTALYQASARGHAATVRVLLDAGADVGIQDGFLNTPLHGACLSRCLAVVEALVAAGADVNARGHEGRAPLDVAAARDAPDLLRFLIEAGPTLVAGASPDTRPCTMPPTKAMSAPWPCFWRTAAIPAPSPCRARPRWTMPWSGGTRLWPTCCGTRGAEGGRGPCPGQVRSERVAPRAGFSGFSSSSSSLVGLG